MGAGFVNRHNMGMIEPGHQPGLPPEAGDPLLIDHQQRVENFEGDRPVERGVIRPENRAEPAGADLRFDLVFSKATPGFLCHPGILFVVSAERRF